MAKTDRNRTSGAGQPETTHSKPARKAKRPGIRPIWVLVFFACGAALTGFAVAWIVSDPGLPARVGDFALTPPASSDASNTDPAPADKQPQEAANPEFVVGLPQSIDQLPDTTQQLKEEAASVADQLLENFPDSPDAMEVAARLYDKFGRSDQAKAIWERCVQLDPNYAYAFHGLASLALKEGDQDKAISLYRRAVLLDPRLMLTQLELASTLIDAGRLDEAITFLQRNVKQDPKAYRGYVLMGMAYLQKEDYQQAKASYEAALELDPGHASAEFGLAKACRGLNLDEEAKRHLERYRDLRGTEMDYRLQERQQYDDLEARRETVASIYMDVGQVYLTRNGLAATERVWRRALTLNDQDIRPYQALAALYRKQGKLPKTIEMFTRLLDMNPKNLPARLEIARLYAQTGQPEAAEEELKRLCKEAPDDVDGFAALTQLYMQMEGRAQEAVTAAEQAVKASPSAPIYALLGSAKRSVGDTQGALEAFKQAADLAPDNMQYLQIYDLLKEQQE